MASGIYPRDSVDIIASGLIGNRDIADGRIIPVLILDCMSRPDLLDLVIFHQDQPPGDVISTWCKNLLHPSRIFLLLEFKRPTQCKAFLRFNLPEDLELLDSIFQTNAIYIQPNKFGLKVSDGLDKPKIMVEIKTQGAPFDWDSLCIKWTLKKLIKEGVPKKIAKVKAPEIIKLLRAFHRFPPRN